MENQIRAAVRPLPPADVKSLDDVRVVIPNLNDSVNFLFRKLWATPDFYRYLVGVYDEQCVEGSRATDNVFAAVKIREAAIAEGDMFVGGQHIHSIVKSLNVVLRRYNLHPKQRMNVLNNEQVPAAPNGGEE